VASKRTEEEARERGEAVDEGEGEGEECTEEEA